ncbi:MAG: DUF4291 domain-containing protein [Actinomycetaceae bacterium]|nr:DUF4291 domain-containing protein [Actinomycetaceae bacterium]
MTENIPYRQIRADFTDDTIVVYQAYRHEIANAAINAGTFAPPFSRTRMTWIKPSFLWMMYRCGWATKPGQERVLRLHLSRSGFETLLGSSSLSHFDPDIHASHEEWKTLLSTHPVRIQWDPERTPSGAPLKYRSLQLGIGSALVDSFVDEWIVDLEDITELVTDLRSHPDDWRDHLPEEKPYPLPADLATHIGASPPTS